jgi:hypothetical protein
MHQLCIHVPCNEYKCTKHVLIYNYILIKTQLSNLVKLFKLLRILCIQNEYVCTYYYVQIQVKFENTKEVIRYVNRIRTDNTMA